MSEEPTPPPEEDAEHKEGEPELYPFIDVAAGGGAEVQVRAGWAREEDGTPEALVVNYAGSAASPVALKSYEAALEWYRDTVRALAEAQLEEAEGAEG